jgi:hypothetical protein
MSQRTGPHSAALVLAEASLLQRCKKEPIERLFSGSHRTAIWQTSVMWGGCDVEGGTAMTVYPAAFWDQGMCGMEKVTRFRLLRVKNNDQYDDHHEASSQRRSPSIRLQLACTLNI